MSLRQFLGEHNSFTLKHGELLYIMHHYVYLCIYIYIDILSYCIKRILINYIVNYIYIYCASTHLLDGI